MSLVHEALQKAEREKQRKTGVAPISSAVPIPKPAPSEPRTAAPIASAAVAKETVAARPTAPPPAATPQRQQTIMPVVIACVAVVAIVAIVYLVSQATSTIRRSNEVVSASAAHGESRGAGAERSRSVATAPTVPVVQPAALTEQSPPAATPALAAAAAAEPAGFKLTGIMKDPASDKFAAVLNGRVVYEGYSVEGATVKKIERDRVTLDLAGRETVLRLF
jgi:hypothetical protein